MSPERADGRARRRDPPPPPGRRARAPLPRRPRLQARLRILCDPAFLRRYRAFHGAPPLLGLQHRRRLKQGEPAPRFTSTTAAVPPFPHPGSDGRLTRPLDCRHGRVLIHRLEDQDLLVWDPVTGERIGLPQPEMDIRTYSAVVLCAADGCDHLDCHGGPFRVVFVSSNDNALRISATVYSSDTGKWRTPTTFSTGLIVCIQDKRGTVIGDEIYFGHWSGTEIVKYDWVENCLSVIEPPPPGPEVYKCMFALMAMDDSSLGFAGIENSGLHIWSRKMKTEGAPEWVQCRVIDLEKIMPMAKPCNGKGVHVVGFAEGVGIIFVSTDVGLFMIELKSGRVRKVDGPGVYYSVLPYMSFYTPDHGRLSTLVRLTDVRCAAQEEDFGKWMNPSS